MKLKKAVVHFHHISSHFTSAMFPAAAILLTLFFLIGGERLESAAYYCVIFGALASPVVYGTGAYDWRTRFQARRTSIFDHKLFFGMALLILSLAIVVSRIVWPDIATAANGYRWFYLILVYAATGTATYLGHLGSKFI